MRKKQWGVFFITSLFSLIGRAVDVPSASQVSSVLTTVNPANVMNTLNQTLPEAEPPLSKGFQVIEDQTKQNHPITDVGPEPKFVLRQVKLLGDEHPVPKTVTAIYQAAFGKPISLQGVQRLAEQMEQAYRAAGYILVQVIVPPQEIELDQGILQLQVVEGQIQRIIFTGDSPHAAQNQLNRYALQIEDEDPITYQTIDHFLVLANQIPGIDVSATLVPVKGKIGAADLLVNIQQTPISGFINFNNRGTSYIGPGQASFGAAIYDILGADTFAITGATSTSNPKQLVYSNFNYDVIVGKYGTEIDPNVSITQTQPGSSLSMFDMYGESEKYSLNVYQPLYVSTPQNLTFESELYHLNSFNSVFQSEQLYNDNITGVLFGLEYQGVFWGTYNDINASTTIGLPILGAPSSLSNPSTINGQTEFVKFDLLSSQIHYLTDHLSLAVNSQMQLTSQALLASEQIGYGGPIFGQAFIPYVISGDNGVMGSVALRYDLPTFSGFRLIQPQIFYDIGAVTDNNAPSGLENGASGQSLGVDVNTQFAQNWQCGITMAKSIRITQTQGINLGWNAFFNFTAIF